jgi:hypothetical protein
MKHMLMFIYLQFFTTMQFLWMLMIFMSMLQLMVLTLKSHFPNSYVVTIDHDACPFTNCDSLTNDFCLKFQFLEVDET